MTTLRDSDPNPPEPQIADHAPGRGVRARDGDDDDLLALELLVSVDLGGSTASGAILELGSPGDVHERRLGDGVALADGHLWLFGSEGVG